MNLLASMYLMHSMRTNDILVLEENDLCYLLLQSNSEWGSCLIRLKQLLHYLNMITLVIFKSMVELVKEVPDYYRKYTLKFLWDLNSIYCQASDHT